MTDEIATANKRLVRRFYRDVYVDWHMTLVDEVVSPQFKQQQVCWLVVSEAARETKLCPRLPGYRSAPVDIVLSLRGARA
jgi:hypothetical protein